MHFMRYKSSLDRLKSVWIGIRSFFLSVEAKMTQIKRKHHKKCDKQNELKNSLGDF